MLILILVVAAFVLFLLAAASIPSRIGLGWLAAACLTLVLLIKYWPGH